MSYSFAPITASFLPLSSSTQPLFRHPKFAGVWTNIVRNDRFGLGCHAVYKQEATAQKEVVQDQLRLDKGPDVVGPAMDAFTIKQATSRGIKELVETVRTMLKSMGDGEISVSPYDTAWVAQVRDPKGDGPLFPSSLEWIIRNQLPDGSWGDRQKYLVYDRIINTLACVVALESWKLCPDKCQRGIAFLKEHINDIEKEPEDHMLIGFELAFTALIDIAKGLGIEVFEESDPIIQGIYAKRSLKLSKIPIELIHAVTTTVLYSLEGMALANLDWEKLLKLLEREGSFGSSPASTAFALMKTYDPRCYDYLNKIVQQFDGGVPVVYPVDLFERSFGIDRLQRLGISRYFQSEILDNMSYVYRYWTDIGVCWGRYITLFDIDDTSMTFRMLRLHGFEVSADVFKNFEEDGEFFSFRGQSNESIASMFNLIRATQFQYPGEDILKRGRIFSTNFLRQRQASNTLFDKWFICKDLAGEVGYALDMPWYASLPRVETRFFLEQYGGGNDVWIGKALYRMYYVSNDTYLELGKLDYNQCQSLHRLEWDGILRWYSECNLGELGVSERSLLQAYFLAMATIFEPEKSSERLAWAKTATLLEAIASNFGKDGASADQRNDFLDEFQTLYMSQASAGNGGMMRSNTNRGQGLLGLLVSTLNQLSSQALQTYSQDIRHPLYQAWLKWVMLWKEEGDRHKGEAELLVRAIELCGGRHLGEDPQSLCLLDQTNQVCQQLGLLQSHDHSNVQIIDMDSPTPSTKLEEDLQKLVELLYSKTYNDVDSSLKQTCLAVAKTFYYVVHCSPQQIDYHISKVLFQKVD